MVSFNKKYQGFYQSYLQVEKLVNSYKNLSSDKTQKLDDIFSKKMKTIEQLNNKDFIYIPYCFSLLSQFPYISTMHKVLDALVKVSIDKGFNEMDMAKFVIHLINEVPVPPNDKKVVFYLPYIHYGLELNPLILKERPLVNSNIKILFDLLSIETILMIFNLIILEQRLLFVHDDIAVLSEVIDHIVSLLYPFKWPHTYIPILPYELIKFLQSFMPYIMGLEESVFETHKYFKEEDQQNLYIVNLKKNVIIIFEKKKQKKLCGLSKMY